MIRLKELREYSKKSMAQVARDLSIPYTTYVNYEKGTREPNSETLIMLADYFDCSVDYLLYRSDIRIDDSVLDKVNEIDTDLLEKHGNIYQAGVEQKFRNMKKDDIRFAAYQELEGESDEVVEDVLKFIKFVKSQKKDE